MNKLSAIIVTITLLSIIFLVPVSKTIHGRVTNFDGVDYQVWLLTINGEEFVCKVNDTMINSFDNENHTYVLYKSSIANNIWEIWQA